MKKTKIIAIVGLILAVLIGLTIKAVKIEKKQYYSKTNEEILNMVEESNTDEELRNVIYEETKEIDNEETIGNLRIPKINLEAPIKEGSSPEILKEYVGHIIETTYYNGTVGLAAHNRGNKFSYFARLSELEEGDEIYYESIYGEKTYKVVNKKIIDETDWSPLKNTNENKLTLITCVKDRKEKRLCVEAIEVL
jgi:LPXTG-site transpeptidase (sortase) family protein